MAPAHPAFRICLETLNWTRSSTVPVGRTSSAPHSPAQAQYGRSHINANTTTTFNIPDITGIYGMSPAYAQSYIDGLTIMPILTVSGGFSGGETNSPSANLTNIHEYLGSVTKTLGRHTIQAGGGWDQFNYGSIIRQGTITFSGASTANFAANPGSLAGCQRRSGQRTVRQWPR